jgi:hypothetical protein
VTTTQAKQTYRGVLCFHCRQPIPLSASGVRREKDITNQEASDLDDFAPRHFTLRCRACHKEGFYTPTEVIDCEGAPRDRGRQTRPIIIDAKRKLIA